MRLENTAGSDNDGLHVLCEDGSISAIGDGLGFGFASYFKCGLDNFRIGWCAYRRGINIQIKY